MKAQRLTGEYHHTPILDFLTTEVENEEVPLKNNTSHKGDEKDEYEEWIVCAKADAPEYIDKSYERDTPSSSDNEEEVKIQIKVNNVDEGAGPKENKGS